MMRKPISLFIGVLAVLAVAAAPAWGETIVVDASDTTPDFKGGTLVCGILSGDRQADPCNTIQHGVERANSGDTVQVAPGSYPERVVIDKALTLEGTGGPLSSASAVSAGGLVFGQATTRPVIEPNLNSLGKATVDLDGDGTTDIDSENRQPVIWVHDADNVTIENFIIRDSSPSGSLPAAPRGVYVTVDSNLNNGSSDNFTFRNNEVKDLSSNKQQARGLAFNVEEDPTSGGDSKDGSEGRATNPVIANNTFVNINGTNAPKKNPNDRALGIALGGDIQGATIADNFLTVLTSSSTQVKAISLTEDGATPKVGPS